VPRLLGMIGLLVVCAGVHLLWQSRHDVAYWIAAFFRMFRTQLREAPPSRADLLAHESPAARREGTLRLLLGAGLLFFLGPLLIALGLTLMLY
jgi:hypothetical protein